MKTPNLIRCLIVISTTATLMSMISRSPAAELRPLVVVGIPHDSVAIHYTAPSYPQTAKALGIEGDVRLLVRVEQGEIVKVTIKSGGPMLADYSSRWVQRSWKFKPSVSGEYFLPISYRLHS